MADIKGVPTEIWLQVGEDCDCEDFDAAIMAHGEDVTWCKDKTEDSDIGPFVYRPESPEGPTLTPAESAAWADSILSEIKETVIAIRARYNLPPSDTDHIPPLMYPEWLQATVVEVAERTQDNG